MKLLKFFLAIVLLPACVSLTMTALKVARHVASVAWSDGRWAGWAFAAGYGLWLVVFCLLPRPMRTYVLGHELTHALWALMMGARVGRLRVSKQGGEVQTSKTNWAITLAPYFFPFYAMLFIVLFFVSHWIWGLERHLWLLFFLVGLGWSFHVTFTLMVLFATRQPDVQSQGYFFSAVVIYLMNLVMILAATAALAESIRFLDLGRWLFADLWEAYRWALDKLGWLWHRLRADGLPR
ncbi:MAG: hypothetical protein NZ483_02875 [Verrucomicrobiae bacterium]|nr:hypothetical protein [Verrucomicrobiae bacterium]MDW8343871.1 hypothetical protein [Verrucomicrobiae bacterium]